MAVSVKRSDLFPPTTSVGAYPLASRRSGGHPVGAAVETHEVDAEGKCGPFTTLVANALYVLYGEVEGKNRYLAVSDSGFTAPSASLPARIKAHREAAGVI